jgi:hypothetical protein
MVVVEEQREVQLRNAAAEEKFWSDLRDMNQRMMSDHRRLIASAQQAIAKHQAAADDADARAKAASERKEKIERDESVDGGLGRPLGHDDWIKLLLDQGFTRHELRYLEAAGQLPEDEFLEMARNWLRDSDKRFERAIIKLVKLFNQRCNEADGRTLDKFCQGSPQGGCLPLCLPYVAWSIFSVQPSPCERPET